MEHLIDLISQEFTLAKYNYLEGGIWKHSIHNDFWVIVLVEGDYDLEKLQEEKYESLEKFRMDYPSSEKSTSLLILQLLHNDYEKNYKRVIDDENNVFYFKKYVIQYSEAEWIEAMSLLENGQSLGKILMQTDVFERVKQDANSGNALLYTVAHKLPFIMMRAERKSYAPNPSFSFNEDLQPLFESIEQFPDMHGKTPNVNELMVASQFIDQLIKNENNEQD